MSRKSHSFGQVLEYINAPERTGPAILQSLHTNADDLKAIEKQFLDNSRYLPPRKNGNVLYHEILSFSDLDRDRATPAILEDLTRKYLELRAPGALAYGKAHYDTDCPHVHVLISANEAGSPRRLRLSRGRFAGIKREIEACQREQYPFLEHSLVGATGRGGSARHRRAESERARREQKQGEKTLSRKDQVRQTVLDQLTVAQSGAAFYRDLKTRGLRLYRRGQAVAVEDLKSGHRYRLRTLRLEEAFTAAMRQWKALPQRLECLRDLELKPAQERWNELGVHDAIREVLDLRKEARPRRRGRSERSPEHGL